MESNNLELRMYGMTIYQLSGRQIGIQFGHAKDEYGRIFRLDESYRMWLDKWKTYIILNGGTTHDAPNSDKADTSNIGTIQLYMRLLRQFDVKFAEFREPDLNDTLTAVAFLVDERVFNEKKYPNPSWMKTFQVDLLGSPDVDFGNYSLPNTRVPDLNEISILDNMYVAAIGGPKNVLLRYMLKGMKLA